MRIAASLLVLSTASVANADTGASFDFGYTRSRVAVTDQTVIDGELGRFAIRFSRRHFHFGAEAEEGRLSGSTALPAGAVARTATGASAASPLDGNTLGLKVFAGLHTNVGAFRIGGDVAGGMRDSWVSSDEGPDVAGRKNEPLLELRSRVDLWLSRSATIGVIAGTDVIERRDVSLGLVFALNFTRGNGSGQ